MATYEIPLSPEAQTFSIQLAGITYQCDLTFNSISNLWTLGLSSNDGTPIIRSIPLVANSDLLAPYSYLNLGGKLVLQTDGAPDEEATYENLGTLSHLYFITP